MIFSFIVIPKFYYWFWYLFIPNLLQFYLTMNTHINTYISPPAHTRAGSRTFWVPRRAIFHLELTENSGDCAACNEKFCLISPGLILIFHLLSHSQPPSESHVRQFLSFPLRLRYSFILHLYDSFFSLKLCSVSFLPGVWGHDLLTLHPSVPEYMHKLQSAETFSEGATPGSDINHQALLYFCTFSLFSFSSVHQKTIDLFFGPWYFSFLSFILSPSFLPLALGCFSSIPALPPHLIN